MAGTAQEMVGAGRIPVSCVDQLRAIGTASPPLLDALIAFLADGNEWAAERLAGEPGWVLDSALRQTGNRKVFAEHLTQLHPRRGPSFETDVEHGGLAPTGSDPRPSGDGS